MRTMEEIHQISLFVLYFVATRLPPAPAAKIILAMDIEFGDIPVCVNSAAIFWEILLFLAEIGLLSDI